MTINRYKNDTVFGVNAFFGTARNVNLIRQAYQSNRLEYSTKLLHGRERLDTIAGEVYGNGNLWWLIAAASDIGWGLQIPPGTILNIPTLESVMAIIG